jgi:type II secretory pathway component PulF
MKMSVKRALWTKAARLEMYDIVGVLTDRGDLDFPQALIEVQKAMQKRNMRVAASIVKDLNKARHSGNLAEILMYYTKGSERMLLSGIDTAEPSELFAGAARMMRIKQRVSRAIVDALAMPFIFLFLFVILLSIMQIQLLPIVVEVIGSDDLPNLIIFTKEKLDWMAANNLILSLAIIGFVGLIVLSMPMWPYWPRKTLDNFFPFNLYKLNMAVGFWLLVIEKVRGGSDLNVKEFSKISETMTFYGAYKMQQIINVVGDQTIAESVIAADKDWPNGELNSIFSVFSKQPSWETSFSNYFDHWVSGVEISVKRSAKAINFMLLVAVAACIGVILMIFFQIMQSI